MKDINLKTITEKLLLAQEEWEDSQIKLPPLELEYQSRLDQLILSSQRPSQPLREAEANEIVRQEDIYVKYWEARLKARIATQRLDTFKVVSSNLRNLAFAEN
jgi:2-succinyl-5-enolpyruvyl-6-hydroxy-3-cyclohexene-1-carboxylate synthase